MKWTARYAVLICALGAAPTASGATLDAATQASHPAVVALLESAEQNLNSGNPAQAAALLERALGIEPRNAAVWHQLGRARLAQGHPAQAEMLAVKSHSLGADDRALRERNARLTAIAVEASGKSVDEMNKALQRFAARRPPAAEIAPASGYADFGLAQRADAAPEGGAAYGDDAALQRGRLVRRIPGWRRFDDALTARRERAARRSEAAQQYVRPDRRSYRRHD